MMSFLSSEFKLAAFTLDHPEPELFLTSKWQKSSSQISRWYVTFRWFCAVYHTCWVAACFLSEGGIDSSLDRKLYYFIYLTQWSYILLTIMNIVWAVIVTRTRRSHTKGQNYLVKTMGVDLKVLWVMINLSILPAILITAVYWLAVYDPAYGVSATSVETHIFNSVYVVVELTVSAVPVRILHFYLSMIYLVVYLAFNLIYFLFGGLTPEGYHAIYPIMDWKNLTVTIPFLLLTMLLTILVQSFVWSISVGSKYFVNGFYKSPDNPKDIQMTETDTTTHKPDTVLHV